MGMPTDVSVSAVVTVQFSSLKDTRQSHILDQSASTHQSAMLVSGFAVARVGPDREKAEDAPGAVVSHA